MRPGAWGRKVALSLGFEKSGARPRRERPFRHGAARLAQTKRASAARGSAPRRRTRREREARQRFGSGVDRLQQAETVRRALNIDKSTKASNASKARDVVSSSLVIRVFDTKVPDLRLRPRRIQPVTA